MDRVMDREELILGPIYDHDGNLRFENGEVAPDEFVLRGGKRYAEGVAAG
jgi:hypothetical protein